MSKFQFIIDFYRRKSSKQQKEKRVVARRRSGVNLSKTQEMVLFLVFFSHRCVSTVHSFQNVVIETSGVEYEYSDYATEVERKKRNRRNPNQDTQQPTLPTYASRIVEFDEKFVSGNYGRILTIILIKDNFRYIRPFLVRKFTAAEKHESTMKLTNLAFRWYENVEQVKIFQNLFYYILNFFLF